MLSPHVLASPILLGTFKKKPQIVETFKQESYPWRCLEWRVFRLVRIPTIWFTFAKRLVGIFSTFPFRGRLRSCPKTSLLSPTYSARRSTVTIQVGTRDRLTFPFDTTNKKYFITGFASSCILALGVARLHSIIRYLRFSLSKRHGLHERRLSEIPEPDFIGLGHWGASRYCPVHLEFDILRWITRQAYQTSATWSHVFDVEGKATHKLPRQTSQNSVRCIDLASVLSSTNSRIRSLNPIQSNTMYQFCSAAWTCHRHWEFSARIFAIDQTRYTLVATTFPEV